VGQGYLIDSNVIIDYFNGLLPEFGRKFLNQITPVISVITIVEIFGGKSITAEEHLKLQGFAEVSVIYPVDQSIALIAINLKQKSSIKLADSLVAATAIYYNLKLVTRNISDFKIEGLEVINPHKI
jgi:toxin FitB